MPPRDHDALLLDLDGTLVADDGRVRPAVAASLRRADEAGVLVMIVTGRSTEGTQPVLDELGLDGLAVVYNGAGLYCPREGRLLEERLLSNRAIRSTHALARERGYPLLVQRAGQKYVSPLPDDAMRSVFANLEAVHECEDWDLPLDLTIRATLFSDRHEDSAAFHAELSAELEFPVYWTHFPLNALADHRASALQVVDVHPPCRGKAEALRVVAERHGIPPARVVTVGDANNDVPMLEAAGLGVAMAGSMQVALDAADRVIGSCNSDAIAELVGELFGV